MKSINTKKRKTTLQTGVGSMWNSGVIIFAGKDIWEAQEQVFKYVDQRRPPEEAMDVTAARNGYSWMSCEHCPTGDILLRFRGDELTTFSTKGKTRQEAEQAARQVFKCLPDKAAA